MERWRWKRILLCSGGSEKCRSNAKLRCGVFVFVKNEWMWWDPKDSEIKKGCVKTCVPMCWFLRRHVLTYLTVWMLNIVARAPLSLADQKELRPLVMLCEGLSCVGSSTTTILWSLPHSTTYSNTNHDDFSSQVPDCVWHLKLFLETQGFNVFPCRGVTVWPRALCHPIEETNEKHTGLALALSPALQQHKSWGFDRTTHCNTLQAYPDWCKLNVNWM